LRRTIGGDFSRSSMWNARDGPDAPSEPMEYKVCVSAIETAAKNGQATAGE
jgi:hypothetical protein